MFPRCTISPLRRKCWKSQNSRRSRNKNRPNRLRTIRVEEEEVVVVVVVVAAADRTTSKASSNREKADSRTLKTSKVAGKTSRNPVLKTNSKPDNRRAINKPHNNPRGKADRDTHNNRRLDSRRRRSRVRRKEASRGQQQNCKRPVQIPARKKMRATHPPIITYR